MELLARTCSTDKMNVYRIVARLFVVFGGVIWTAAAFGASFTYEGKPLGESIGTAFLPLAITVVALAVGWFYENLAALLLFIGAAVAFGWGLVASWEAGMWMLMVSVLIAPMGFAGLLFMLAARMQKICTLEGVLPE